MAKTTPGLKQALKVVKQLGKQMNAESMADYNIAMSASAAGTKNLAKQTRALTRDLVLGQRFNQAAVQGYAARAKASQRKVVRREDAARSKYGEALGGSIAESYNKAQATGSAGTMLAKGAVKGSNQAAAAARTVAGIASAGVRANRQAANYAMAQALQARNMVTAETLAGLTGQLYQTAMEYNMQWDLWKKQQDYAAKQAEKEGVQNKGDVKRLIGEGSDIGLAAAEDWRELRGEPGSPTYGQVDITAAAQQYARDYNYDPAGPEVRVYTAMMREFKNGTNTAEEAYTNAFSYLFGDMKGYESWGAPAAEAAAAKAQTNLWANSYTDWLQANPDIASGAADTPGSGNLLNPDSETGFGFAPQSDKDWWDATMYMDRILGWFGE